MNTEFRRTSPRSLAIGVLLIAVLLPTSLLAQDASGLETTGEWQLVVAGATPEDARVWFSDAAATFVVKSAELPFPVLIDIRSGQVFRLDPAAVGSTETLSVPASARGEAVSKIVPGQGEALFSVHGTVARLRYSALTGEHSREGVFAHSPEYRRKADAYEPTAADMTALEAFDRPVRVRVVFGTWCGVCKTYMPHAMRVDRELEGSKIEFEYFGLPAQDPWQHPEVARLQLDQVPTAIVFVDGREVGRLEGAEGFRDPEAALRSVLEKAG